MAGELDGDDEAQDQAEVFDEDNRSFDGDMLTLEEMPDVPDVTAAAGDDDDDAALIGEDLDDDEIIALAEERDDVDLEDDDMVRQLEEETHVALYSGLSGGGADEAGLVYVADVDPETDLDEDNSAVVESDTLDDDDLEDLDYKRDDGSPMPPIGAPD